MDRHERRLSRRIASEERRPPPGEGGIVLLGLSVGIMLMGVQLWLLTLAFDLYMLDEDGKAVLAALFSGLVFLGGLAMLRFVGRRPRRSG